MTYGGGRSICSLQHEIFHLELFSWISVKLFSWISDRQMAETLCRLEKGPHLANGSHPWIENEAEKVD